MLYFQRMDMLVRCALTEPMWQRLKRQEGALLAIVASTLFFMGTALQTLVTLTALTLLTLSTLYLFNDLTDCIEDQNNPRKDQRYVSTLIEYRSRYWVWLALQKLLVLGLAWNQAGTEGACVVLAVFLINTSYSLKLKGIPYIDVIWVGLWGAAITAMAGLNQPIASFILVGIMTAISHIYQVRLDAPVDNNHNVKTSAVLSHQTTEIQIMALCLGFGAILVQSNLSWLSISAFAPWILGKYLKSNHAWVLARYYFGIIWLCYLESVYGRLAQF